MMGSIRARKAGAGPAAAARASAASADPAPAFASHRLIAFDARGPADDGDERMIGTTGKDNA